MEHKKNVYTVFACRVAGKDYENFHIDIERYDKNDKLYDTPCLSDHSLENLVRHFVETGWTISQTDAVKTVDNLIINQWARKPWRNIPGSPELLADNGETFLYRGLSAEELNDFYKQYAKRIERNKNLLLL